MLLLRRQSFADAVGAAVANAVNAGFLKQEKSEIRAHLEECGEYRQKTNERLGNIETTTATLKEKVEGVADAIAALSEGQKEQHRQNLGSLRWQRGLLILILLSVLGFLGTQIYTRVYGQPAGITHSLRGNR